MTLPVRNALSKLNDIRGFSNMSGRANYTEWHEDNQQLQLNS